MCRWSIGCAAMAASLVFHSSLFAQAPAIPGVPAAPAVPGAPAAAPAPAAAGNIWSKICLTPEQKQACKQKLCAIPLVQMFNGTLTPLSAMSGGLLPSCCPGPNQANPADLMKPSDSAEGAASRIKKKEAEAKARRAAVRYLGTVDCRRYPEAEAALISSLRGDENECVRFEAALALSNGCCCTKKVMEALVATVSGKKTNDPAETSLRVRYAAACALERCLANYCEVDSAPDRPAEPSKPASDDKAEPKKEGPKAQRQPDPLADEGRQVLAAFKATYTRPSFEPPTAAPAPLPTPAPPVVMQVAATKPPPVQEKPTATDAGLPPTGRRDMWSIIRHSVRGR
jgi:hypothetical protein